MLLEKILTCYSRFDTQIGYVQGMNFIGGAILYHSEEYMAFWILVMILDMLGMKDVYLPGPIHLVSLMNFLVDLPGLSKHLEIIEILLLQHHPDIYKTLVILF
eukprot:TRINITY_DN11894_c0_g1_i1.p1 TRINITY_DN11894_c0_g1~~TRINITY_DN11894_c0_g1_i1.p1  ORF type:complete len:103 (-),score=16.76 TRINITY_DN11894_c0_g1_i1:426-734(-)